jgi:hypothetical protein
VDWYTKEEQNVNQTFSYTDYHQYQQYNCEIVSSSPCAISLIGIGIANVTSILLDERTSVITGEKKRGVELWLVILLWATIPKRYQRQQYLDQS